jgi:holo-[acyl-carrier protein] synthase
VIVGVGVDIVDVDRFAAVLRRTPRVRERLFTPRERARPDGTMLDVRSLAARFASKEAVAKALGVPSGMAWHDCEVLADVSGRPRLALTWTVAAAAAALGAVAWPLSISHDAGLAVAYVVAESG